MSECWETAIWQRFTLMRGCRLICKYEILCVNITDDRGLPFCRRNMIDWCEVVRKENDLFIRFLVLAMAMNVWVTYEEKRKNYIDTHKTQSRRIETYHTLQLLQAAYRTDILSSTVWIMVYFRLPLDVLEAGKNGVFPDTKDFKCYISCLLDMMQVVRWLDPKVSFRCKFIK